MQDDAEGMALLLASHKQHLDAMKQNQNLNGVIEQLRLLKAPLE
jgi:hypothetical protein